MESTLNQDSHRKQRFVRIKQCMGDCQAVCADPHALTLADASQSQCATRAAVVERRARARLLPNLRPAGVHLPRGAKDFAFLPRGDSGSAHLSTGGHWSRSWKTQ